MTSGSGQSISVDPAKHTASVHGGILGCTDCHTKIKDYPHPVKVAKVQCATCHADESSHMPNSVHSALGEAACQSCHGDHHEVAEAAKLAPAGCAQCHADEVKEFRQSIHGQAADASDPDAPNCMSCHGPVHQIQTSGDLSSTVAKKNLPDTCASCHSNQQFLSRHKIPFAHPVELYKQSVHGRAVVNGDGAAATCSDCHGSHGILPSQDARSKVNHFNIPATCGQCHADISKTYLESVHGQAMESGEPGAPVCSDCHGEHLILAPQEQGSLVNASRVSTVTCGRCHSDERLALRYNLPADRVPSFADSTLPKLIALPILAAVLLVGTFSIFAQTSPARGGAMSFQLSSAVFSSGATIPEKYACDGPDVSPPLSWKDVPASTQSLALIMDDPDAPAGTWVHWVLYNLPANTRELPEEIEKQEQTANGALQGRNDFREADYNGPCPPPGKPHRYYFKLYALDSKLNLKAGATKAELEQAMKAHTLAETELIGRFGR